MNPIETQRLADALGAMMTTGYDITDGPIIPTESIPFVTEVPAVMGNDATPVAINDATLHYVMARRKLHEALVHGRPVDIPTAMRMLEDYRRHYEKEITALEQWIRKAKQLIPPVIAGFGHQLNHASDEAAKASQAAKDLAALAKENP